MVHLSYVVEDGGFRYKVSIHKGLGIFHGCDADCAINIGDNTEREIGKKIKIGFCEQFSIIWPQVKKMLFGNTSVQHWIYLWSLTLYSSG